MGGLLYIKAMLFAVLNFVPRSMIQELIEHELL